MAGPALFTLLAGALMFVGGALLEYPAEYTGILILAIEVASAVSIGMTLILLFAGGRPHRGYRE